MWSPPDMSKIPNFKYNELSTPKNERFHSMSKSPKSKSPRKELHRQLSNGSLKSLRSPKNIVGPKDVPPQL
jgi:hypothetical protein